MSASSKPPSNLSSTTVSSFTPPLWPWSTCSSESVSRFHTRISVLPEINLRQHTPAYVSIRQHTSAYVSIRQHASAYVSMHLPAQMAMVQTPPSCPVSTFLHTSVSRSTPPPSTTIILCHTRMLASNEPEKTRIRQHTSAYVSMRQHASAYLCHTRMVASNEPEKTYSPAASSAHTALLCSVSVRIASTSLSAVSRPPPSPPPASSWNSLTCGRRPTTDVAPPIPPPAYVSIRQHTSAYVSIRQHTSAYVSIRQHTPYSSQTRFCVTPPTPPPHSSSCFSSPCSC
jgi:hypothetical protein